MNEGIGSSGHRAIGSSEERNSKLEIGNSKLGNRLASCVFGSRISTFEFPVSFFRWLDQICRRGYGEGRTHSRDGEGPAEP